MLNLLELAALGFAAYRGTQLLVWDSILDGWHKRVDAWHMDGIRPGRSNRGRTFLKDLISCTYCTGWWVSVITLAAYYTVTSWSGVSVLSFGLNAFAVAGAQALLSRYDDTLPGHKPRGN